MKDPLGIDPSVAVMGPNLKWQIVHKGCCCVQSDTKPLDFQARVCSLEDTLPRRDMASYKEQYQEGFTGSEAFILSVAREIALSIAPPNEEEEEDEDLANLVDQLYVVIPSIGVYEDPTEKTLDDECKRLLSFLQNKEFEKNVSRLPDPTLLTLNDFDVIKGDDKAWVGSIASRLHKEGWELRWDTRNFTAGEILGGFSGQIYLSDGVWVNASETWDATYTPFLYLPCFDGEEDFVALFEANFDCIL